jgi:hypothetical protein
MPSCRYPRVVYALAIVTNQTPSMITSQSTFPLLNAITLADEQSLIPRLFE